MQKKSKTTALILSAVLGCLGVDRFYLGYTGMGVLKLLTCGVFGVFYIIDIVNIATGKLAPEDGSGYEEDSFVTSALPQNAASAFDDLEKLAKLHSQGVVSDAEFEKMKAEVLKKV